jgi:hemerythrin-like domain-containing protein
MQPAEGVRFIHTAIQRDVRQIEALARAARSKSDLGVLKERAAYFAHVNELHTRGEEAGPFAELEARAPHVRDAYLFDHEDDRRLVGELLAEIDRSAEKSAPTEALVRLAVALTEHVDLHVRKENEVLVPLITKLFTPPEQGAAVGKMIGSFSPADLERAFPWIFGHLDPADRVAYLRMLSKVMPAERFPTVAKWIKAGVSAEVWSGIVTGAPELSLG